VGKMKLLEGFECLWESCDVLANL